MKILVIIAILSSLQAIVNPATICANDADGIQPLHKHISDRLRFACHRHDHCAGDYYMYEHLNQSTLRYETVQEGPRYKYVIPTIGLDDGGSYRCWKKCPNGRQSTYCYLGVKVIPDVVVMDFPPNATINTSYSGTCNATASPRPHVYVTVSSDGCLYTTNIVNTSKYTTEVKVIIPQVTARCRNAIITCHAYQITEQFTLNVTENTMPTHPTIILPTATGHSSTTTTTTTSPPNTTAPTDGPLTTGAGSAARSMRSTDFVDLIIIGIQLVYFNTS